MKWYEFIKELLDYKIVAEFNKEWYYFDIDLIKYIKDFFQKIGMVQVNISGLELIPIDGATIISSSHKNWKDIPISTLLTRRIIRFFAKKELFEKHPIINRWFTFGGVIPVDRGKEDREALLRCVNILKELGILLIFPEGTRNKQKGIKDLEKGISTIIWKSKIPVAVVPVGVTYKKGPFLGYPLKITVKCGKPKTVQIKTKTEADRFINILKQDLEQLVT